MLKQLWTDNPKWTLKDAIDHLTGKDGAFLLEGSPETECSDSSCDPICLENVRYPETSFFRGLENNDPLAMELAPPGLSRVLKLFLTLTDCTQPFSRELTTSTSQPSSPPVININDFQCPPLPPSTPQWPAAISEFQQPQFKAEEQFTVAPFPFQVNFIV